MSRVVARLCLPFFILALPSRADAHAFAAGQDEYELFLEGAALPFHTPELALSLLSFSLLVGAWRVDGLPLAWPALIAGACIGMALAFAAASVDPTYALYALAILLGVLVVLAWDYDVRSMRLVAGAAGVAMAYGTVAAHGTDDLPIAALAGILAGLNFWIAAGAALASLPARFIRAAWPALGLRVLGSWLVAITLIMLAFAIRNT